MNLRELRQQAAKHELSLNFVAKDSMITQTLAALQGAEGIVFKGGTAINRIHLKKAGKMRFSEDLDFDIDFAGSAREVIKTTDRIVKSIDIFDSVGKPRLMKSTIRYDLFYTNPLGHKDRIRLEFTAKKISEKHSRQVVNYGFVPGDASLLEVYEKSVFVRHKTDCILTRREGKDIYDLYYLLDDSSEIPKKLADALDMDRNEIRRIADAANHYIPASNRPDWELIVEKLKEKVRSG